MRPALAVPVLWESGGPVPPADEHMKTPGRQPKDRKSKSVRGADRRALQVLPGGAVGSVDRGAVGTVSRGSVRAVGKSGRSSLASTDPSQPPGAPQVVCPHVDTLGSQGSVRLQFRPLDPALLDAVTDILADALVSDLLDFTDVSGSMGGPGRGSAHPQSPPEGA
jgi:hypothetical protein